MTTIIPGPGEDGHGLRDDQTAAEALDYAPEHRERSNQDDERVHFEAHPEELARLRAEEAALAQDPLITEAEAESHALHLGSRALAQIAAGLLRRGQADLAAESARSAEALDDPQRRAVVSASRRPGPEQEAER